jgi:hypothetical protein
MALVPKSTRASMDTSTGMFSLPIAGLICGENIDVAAPVYIKSSDGKLYMSNGTALNEAAEFVGFSPRAAIAGQPLQVVGINTRFKYSDGGLTPGDKYFIAATAGRLDTAATTGGTQAIVRAITAHDIVVIRASE